MPTPVKKWMGGAPDHCDICKLDLVDALGEHSATHFVDGKTVYGPWGIMCVGPNRPNGKDCFTTHGVGLGTGLGQKYDMTTLVKVEG